MSIKSINAFLSKISSMAKNFEVTKEMVDETKVFLKEGGKVDKKEKSKKDPSAPKKPTNAYIIFAKEKRQEIKEESGISESKELIAEIGRVWREHRDSKSETFIHYQEQLNLAKKEYEQQMESYDEPEKEKPKKEKKKKEVEEEKAIVDFAPEDFEEKFVPLPPKVEKVKEKKDKKEKKVEIVFEVEDEFVPPPPPKVEKVKEKKEKKEKK